MRSPLEKGDGQRPGMDPPQRGGIKKEGQCPSDRALPAARLRLTPGLKEDNI